MSEDFALLKSKLARMHSDYYEKLDQIELYSRVSTAGAVVKQLQGDCWELRKSAYRILAKLHDAGWLLTGDAALPFGWDVTHLQDESLRSWLLPKSAETPELESTPFQLGPNGLWHTPNKKVPQKEKLPNYIEHIAHALMRDQGMEESQAIATAINAVKRWAKGDLHWGHGHVHPEVQQASQRALEEWEKLREEHSG